MRLERITDNKIKIFISLDDLVERGLTKEDVWHDSLKWRQLFHDMLEEANREFNVTLQGSIVVEVFSLQAQGMVMIITIEETEGEKGPEDGDSLVDMQVTVGENEDILFIFDSFEHVIQLAKRLEHMNINGGTLYQMDERYFLFFEVTSIDCVELLISLLAEYGNPSLTTVYRLKEYGKEIMPDDAIGTLVHFFA